jgi:hypothetical protein
MIDLKTIGQQLGDLNLWERFHSDIILEVTTVLTEPVCPTATIRFELPHRAGMDIIAHCIGDTIEQAIDKAVALTFERLKETND